jgi:hypothetical protein
VATHIQRALRCAHVTFWDLYGEPGQRRMRRGVAYDGATGTLSPNSIELSEAGGGYFDTLMRSGCYISPDTFADPHLVGVRENVLVPFGIHALLSATYANDGRRAGILTCTDKAPRAWTSTEVTALRRCASEISRQRARRGATG